MFCMQAFALRATVFCHLLQIIGRMGHLPFASSYYLRNSPDWSRYDRPLFSRATSRVPASQVVWRDLLLFPRVGFDIILSDRSFFKIFQYPLG